MMKLPRLSDYCYKLNHPLRAVPRFLAPRPAYLHLRTKIRSPPRHPVMGTSQSRTYKKQGQEDFDIHHFSSDVHMLTRDFSKCCDILLASITSGKSAFCVASPDSKVHSAIFQVVNDAQAGDQAYVDRLESLLEGYDELFAIHSLTPVQAKLFKELTIPIVEELKVILKSIHVARVCPLPILELIETKVVQFEAQLVSVFMQDHGVHVVNVDHTQIFHNSSVYHGSTSEAVQFKVDFASTVMMDLESEKATVFLLIIPAREQTYDLATAALDSTHKLNPSDVALLLAGSLPSTLTMWGHTYGVFTADPKRVEEAKCLPVITFCEWRELSIHLLDLPRPEFIFNAQEYHTHIYMRNLSNQSLCTEINDTVGGESTQLSPPGSCHQAEFRSPFMVVLENIIFVSLRSSELNKAPLVANLVVQAANMAGAEVLLLQSSGWTVSLALRTEQPAYFFDNLTTCLAESFGPLDSPELIISEECAFISLIHKDIDQLHFFSSMIDCFADDGCDILASSLGASANRISFVLSTSEVSYPLRVVHSRLSADRTADIPPTHKENAKRRRALNPPSIPRRLQGQHGK